MPNAKASFIAILFVILAIIITGTRAGSKDKPHIHNGFIEPFDGKPLPAVLSEEELVRLDKGEAVICKERDGKSGRGVVIQDINAPTAICMERIRDVENYIHVVPHVKKVEIYEKHVFPNGTSKTGAEFKVGLMGLSFQYFLQLTHEPKYNTLTWTLDYNKSSDFDDNVGHWQVMPHPSKRGWTRLLYSTKIRAFSWIPEFFVNFLTSKALTESTSWVKREAELAASRLPKVEPPAVGTATQKSSWFNIKGGFVCNPSHLSCEEAQRKIQLRKLQSYRQFPRLSLRFLKK